MAIVNPVDALVKRKIITRLAQRKLQLPRAWFYFSYQCAVAEFFLAAGVLDARRPADANLDASLESFPNDFVAAFSRKRPQGGDEPHVQQCSDFCQGRDVVGYERRGGQTAIFWNPASTGVVDFKRTLHLCLSFYGKPNTRMRTTKRLMDSGVCGILRTLAASTGRGLSSVLDIMAAVSSRGWSSVQV